MNTCSGTARVAGFISAITVAARHICISNSADGVAACFRYSVARQVIAMICATNGRMPRITGEYKFTSDAKHCQYRNVCGS